MAWWSDFLAGSGALKKAAATGDAPKKKDPEPSSGSNDYVANEIARQQKTAATPAESNDDVAKKKQPKVGFAPGKAPQSY